MYGVHSGEPDSKALNELILSEVFRNANAFLLPTLILGDFNINLADTCAWEAAMGLGFCDAVQHLASLEGKQAPMTYRGQSRLDYCIVNRVALPALCACQVDPQGFRDHASLTLSFSWDSLTPTFQVWKMPSDVTSLDLDLSSGELTEEYDQTDRKFVAASAAKDSVAAFDLFCKLFEGPCRGAYIAKHGQPLPKKYLGRGCGALTLRSFDKPVVPSSGGLCVLGVQVRLRVKVVRKFLELCKLRRTRPDLIAPATQCWSKILGAKGFPGGFSQWLLSNDVVAFVPQSVPSLEWLEDVAVHLQHEEQLWVSACRRDAWARTKAFMDDDWQCGGRSHAVQIRPPPSKPLNSLMQELPLDVGRLRHEKGQTAKFRCRPDEQPLPGDVWKFGDISCKVVSVKGNDVSLDRPLSCKMCKNVPKLLRWNADPNFVAAEVQKYWQSFWNTERQPDLQFLADCCNDMAQLPKFSAEISLPELEIALKALAVGKARGMDGFSNGELKLLSPKLKARFLTLLNLVTETGRWPESQLTAYVSLLGKVPEPTTPADARPITVLGTLYRVWANIMARKMIQHMMPWLPKTLHGSIPGRSAEDLAVDIQTCIEDATLQNKLLAGCSLDLSKAYNTIPRPLIWMLADKAGWPLPVQCAYKGFLDGVTRFFQVGGSLLSPTMSKVGVPEGCPVAVVAMILVTSLVSHRTQTCHDVPMRSFVDNWSLQHQEPSKVVAATEEVAMVTQKCGMVLSLDKSLMYANTNQARHFLKKCKIGGQHVPTKNSFQDLGVVFSTRRQASSQNLHGRFSKHRCRFDKLRLRKWTSNRKAKVLNRAVFPAVLYGAATASASASFLRDVRAAANAAVWGHNSNRDHFMAPLVSAAEIYEPFLHVFKQRWSVLRRLWMAGCASVPAVWHQLSGGMGVGNGPVSYFVQQLRRIGWDILPDGKVSTDAGLILELITTPWRDVHSLALDAWTKATAAKARSGIALPVVNIQMIRSGLSSKDGYNSWLAGYLRGLCSLRRSAQSFLMQKRLRVLTARPTLMLNICSCVALLQRGCVKNSVFATCRFVKNRW